MQRVGAQRPPPLLRLARPPGAAFGSTVGGWFRPGPLSPLTAFLSQRYTGFPGGHLRHVPGSRGRALATFRPASEASPLAHSVEARPRPSRVDGWWMGVISTGEWRGAGICGHVFLQVVPLWPFLF